MKKIAILLIAAFVFLMTFSLVSAVDPGEAAVSNEAMRGPYTFAGGSADVQAGNITYADLDTNMSTYRWAGLLGNVSGNIILGEGTGNVMFTWTAIGRVVYASESTGVDWPNLAPGLGAVGGAYYQGGSDNDNFVSTFIDSSTFDTEIFTGLAASPRATTLGGTGWYTYALNDLADPVFAGEVVDAGQAAYDGSSVQYQMILPEDGTDFDQTATAYNLWVELQ